MWDQRARVALVFGSFLLAACGTRMLDFTSPDSGTADSGATTATGGASTAGGTSGAAGSGAITGGGGVGGTGTGGSGSTTGAGGSAGTGSSGTGGTMGGSAGTGGANPDDGGAPPPFVSSNVRAPKVSKIDLLFMIDNSSSMVDKQQVLSLAVPELVDQLIDPRCIDRVTGRVLSKAVDGVCATGERAFEPIKDIHIGLISSSLGNHGANGVCEDAIDVALQRSDPHNDDKAHLLTRGAGGTLVPTFGNKGFLYYNPSAPGALTTPNEVALSFVQLARGTGQHGCGYEASLEAVYRFLVDPDPFDTVTIDTSIGGFGQAILRGTDEQVLQQRRDFLRVDSLVTIVMVTDENDCSISDGGQGFYALLPPIAATGRSALKHGTSKCLDNPNDPCCFNCGQQSPPPGCPAADGDPQCQQGEILVSEDQPNLRCYNQKQRYGVDFMYPVQRYIDGFTSSKVPNRQSQFVDNPLFANSGCLDPGCPPATPRDKSLVVVTGIVGVPWQDIAVDPGDLKSGYKTAKQLRDENVWRNIVGDPLNASGPVPPRDPHMVESILPRQGLAGPGSAPQADAIHGHEWDPSKDRNQPNADLQYACTFNLVTPKICVEAADCDCFGPNLGDVQNPLCQNAQGAYTTTQLRGKAYPAPRILQVLQGMGDQAVLGSICPSQGSDANQADFGYLPVTSAVMDLLRKPLREQCLPVALPVAPDTGETACRLIEVFNAASCGCDTEPGRRPSPEAILTDEIKAQGTCRCEMKQATGAAQAMCRSMVTPPPSSGDGWCYVDAAQQSDATCDLVTACPADQQRRIHFMNANSEPRPGASAILRCDTSPVAPLPPRCP
ncbi:MAG TPA: hypothetical protein VK550_07475 [Polyangiaceae bacterium]|nr:hypothetical protein [Polyangiaceae bacterium]